MVSPGSGPFSYIFFLDHSFMVCFPCFIVKMTKLFLLILFYVSVSFLLLILYDRLDSVSVAAQHESIHDWLTNSKMKHTKPTLYPDG